MSASTFRHVMSIVLTIVAIVVLIVLCVMGIGWAGGYSFAAGIKSGAMMATLAVCGLALASIVFALASWCDPTVTSAFFSNFRSSVASIVGAVVGGVGGGLLAGLTSSGIVGTILLIGGGVLIFQALRQPEAPSSAMLAAPVATSV